MKRTLIVLAILTLIVPAVANAQTLNIRNNPAVAQIVSRVIAGLTGGVPYQNQYSTRQIPWRSHASAFSAEYQNGYAQGAADARRAAQYNQYGSQYGVNNGNLNRYPQNFGNRYDGFQRNARGSWRGGY